MERISLYSLYKVIEMSNGTVNIDTILSMIPKGNFIFEELPDKVFDVDKDIESLEQLLDDYQIGGIKAIQKYGN